jgi:hypothetical protein
VTAEKRARCLAADAADHLANEMPEGQGVVAVGGARLPPRRLVRQRIDHQLPIVVRVAGQLAPQPGQAGAVAEQMARGDRLLAVAGELRPVARHRRIDVERTAVDEHMGAQRRHRLRRRKDVDDGVALPRARERAASA